MASPPPAPVPTISPAEIQILISRAGLVLNPGQVADLVLAWRQVAGLIAAIPRERALADDMALAFRLPPPEAPPPGRVSARTKAPAPMAAQPPAAPRTGRARASAVSTSGKPAGKGAVAASGKAPAKPAGVAARKPVGKQAGKPVDKAAGTAAKTSPARGRATQARGKTGQSRRP